ncbi:aspartic peptidase domain-containing protein [Gongronella butleri]|nr:aspartic peptidase domain-containing protein [Gongronella butleri]
MVDAAKDGGVISLPLTAYNSPIGRKSVALANIQGEDASLARQHAKRGGGGRGRGGSNRHGGGHSTTLPLMDDNGVLWYTTLYIGTPPRPFTVDVDTGSADLFIGGSRCPGHCGRHRTFDVKQSKSARPQDRVFDIKFADKTEARGDVYTETVTIGSMVAHNQVVGIANYYSPGLDKELFAPDGLIGLGTSALSKTNSTPIMDTLFKQGQVSHRMFSVHLSLQPGHKGELTLGGISPTIEPESIVYVPLTSNQFWQTRLQTMTLNGRRIAYNKEMIIDTGSTMINMDARSAMTLFSQVPGHVRKNNKFFYPCSLKFKLHLMIGNHMFEIDSKNCNLGPLSTRSKLCVSGITSTVTANDPWIVGGAFLASVYTVFDIEQNRIGFAQARQEEDHIDYPEQSEPDPAPEPEEGAQNEQFVDQQPYYAPPPTNNEYYYPQVEFDQPYDMYQGYDAGYPPMNYPFDDRFPGTDDGSREDA